MSKLCTTMKTYGPLPKSFKLGSDDEEFMLGSEVGNYLRLFRGDLYKRYPGMWKRKLTADERRVISEQIGYSYNNISTNVQIVKLAEVEDILSMNDDKYRTMYGLDITANSSAPDKAPAQPHSNSGASTRASKKNPWIAQIPSSSYHLDAVPSATSVARCKTNSKKIKSFPTW